jgi:hypothetical protein
MLGMSTRPHLYSVYADDPWYIALVNERDELHAENERLRAALEEIANAQWPVDTRACNIARRALGRV